MKRIKSIFSILVLLSVLLSTSGFTVYKHFCGDYLVAFSIFSPADGCGDEKAGCDDSAKSKMDCCDDESEYFKAEVDLLKPQIVDNSFHFFALPFLIEEKADIPATLSHATLLKDRGPPLAEPPLYITLSRLTYYG